MTGLGWRLQSWRTENFGDGRDCKGGGEPPQSILIAMAAQGEALSSGGDVTPALARWELARWLGGGSGEVEFVAELFVVAAEGAGQGEEVGMGVDGAEMGVVFEGAVVGEADLGGAI
jgi:hypothetical protein